jgi:hypothetical protein
VDFERRTVVFVTVEQAFEFFADPANLPLYVPAMTLDESIAVEGDPGAEPDAEAGPARTQPRFVPDRANHRIEWGEAGEAYGGSIELRQGSPNSTDVQIRLRTRDDADEAKVRELLDQAARSILRRLTAR